MLVITRRVGESLKIGHQVTLTVLGIHDKQARMGVDAPKGVAVCRAEIYERVLEEGPPHKPEID